MLAARHCSRTIALARRENCSRTTAGSSHIFQSNSVVVACKGLRCSLIISKKSIVDYVRINKLGLITFPRGEDGE